MKIDNFCNFYASKYHLSVILMEYIKKINLNDTAVATFFEESIEDEVNEIKNKINNINIDIINFNKNNLFKEKGSSIDNTKKNIVYIISGSNEYMKSVNDYIEGQLSIRENCNNATIINCYDFEQQVNNIDEILNNNNKILCTAEIRNV